MIKDLRVEEHPIAGWQITTREGQVTGLAKTRRKVVRHVDRFFDNHSAVLG